MCPFGERRRAHCDYCIVFRCHDDAAASQRSRCKVNASAHARKMYEEVEECCRRSRDVENIVRLTGLVERLERENQRLKNSPGLLTSAEFSRLQKENEGLRTQLEEVRGSFGGKLSDRYDAKERAASKVARSYEDMRHDLQAVRQQHQRTKKEKEQLNSELAHLRRQNQSLREELQTAQTVRQRTERQRDLLAERVRVVERAQSGKSGQKATASEKAAPPRKTRIDDIKSVSALRQLLKASLRRNRRQRRAQDELQGETTTLRSSGTETAGISVPELIEKIQEQRLRIQRLEAERDFLQRQMELTTGVQIKSSVMDQLVHYTKVIDENAELRSRIRLLENGAGTCQPQSSVEFHRAVTSNGETVEEEEEDEEFFESPEVRALLSSITEDKEAEEAAEEEEENDDNDEKEECQEVKANDEATEKELVLQEAFEDEVLELKSQTRESCPVVEENDITDQKSIHFVVPKLDARPVDEFSQLF